MHCRRTAGRRQWLSTISVAGLLQLRPLEGSALRVLLLQIASPKAANSFPPNSAALGFCLEVQQAGLLGTLNEQL
jgi:hypothetical protein